MSRVVLAVCLVALMCGVTHALDCAFAEAPTYTRSMCTEVASCETQLCSCFNPQSTFRQNQSDMGYRGLNCITQVSSCSSVTNCLRDYVFCLGNATVSPKFSNCTGLMSLYLGMLSFASGSPYSGSIVQSDCNKHVCLIANQSITYSSPEFVSGSTCLPVWQSATCVAPNLTSTNTSNPDANAFLGTLRIQIDSWAYWLFYYDYYRNQIQIAVQNDLGALFNSPVTITKMNTDFGVSFDFKVDAKYATAATLRRGQQLFFLLQLRNFLNGMYYWYQGNILVLYLGPRLSYAAAGCINTGRTTPITVIDGTIINVSMALNPSVGGYCTTGMYDATLRATDETISKNWWSEWSYDWRYWDKRPQRLRNIGQVNFTVSATSFALTGFCPGGDATYKLNVIMRGVVVPVAVVRCLMAPASAPNSFPSRAVVWMNTSDVTVLAYTLLGLATVAGPSTMLYVTSGTGYIINASSFSAAQTLLNTMIDNPSVYSAPGSCSGVQLPPDFVATASDAVIVAGQIGMYCGANFTDATRAALQALFNTVDTMIADPKGDMVALLAMAPNIIILGYPVPATPPHWSAATLQARKTLERYGKCRMERMPSCTGPVMTFPPYVSIPSGADAVVSFTGSCSIVKCCYSGVCSSNLVNNKTACVIPGASSWGIFALTLVDASGNIFQTNTKIDLGGSKDFYIDTWDRPRDDSSGIGILYWRYSANVDVACAQLRCITTADSLDISQLPVYIDGGCGLGKNGDFYDATQYEWFYSYYWYTAYGWKLSSTGWGFGEIAFTRPTVAPSTTCLGLVMTVQSDKLDTVFLRNNDNSSQCAAGTGFGMLANTKVLPVSSTTSTSAATLAWCNAWAIADDASQVVQTRLREAQMCFQCPALFEDIRPRELWQMWGWGSWWFNYYYNEQGSFNQRCMEAWPTSDRPWYRRCCYDNTNRLIKGYPTVLMASRGYWLWPMGSQEEVFGTLTDVNPRQVCCQLPSSTTDSCNIYKSRRNAGLGTNSPFTIPRNCNRTWTASPPFAWGRGDPYCTSFDGLGFECNFVGEALWASCKEWRVQVTASRPSPDATATIINGVGVKEGSDTVIITRDNETGLAITTFNDKNITGDSVSGQYLTVALSRDVNNRTIVKVVSVNKHQVEVQALPNFFSVGVAQGTGCTGICKGLTGNCDGDKSNDLVSRDGTVTLAADASGTDIYTKIVQSYVITNTSESMFLSNPVALADAPPPTSDSNVTTTPVSTSFVPKFISTETISNCPAVCNKEPGCCLDAQVVGTSFAATTATAVATIAEVAKTTVAVGYNWGPVLTMPGGVSLITGSPLSLFISAADTDGIANYSISHCTTNPTDCKVSKSADNTVWNVSITTATAVNETILVSFADANANPTVSNGMIDVIVVPPPPPPSSPNAGFSFELWDRSATGPAWGAQEIQQPTAVSALLSDLTNAVNAKFGYTRRATTPRMTTADVVFNSARDIPNGGKRRATVTVYFLGANTADATARAQAIDPTKKLALPQFSSALAAIVPGAQADLAVVGFGGDCFSLACSASAVEYFAAFIVMALFYLW